MIYVLYISEYILYVPSFTVSCMTTINTLQPLAPYICSVLARNILQSGRGGYIFVQFTKIIVHFACYLRATRNGSDAIPRANNRKK